MPVAILERDVLGTANTGDWLIAGIALLGKQFREAIRAVGKLVARSKSLPSQGLLTIGAVEAFSMVGRVLVRHAALRDHLAALVALGGKVVLVAGHAVDLLVLGYEALGADRRVAREAQETVLVKLLALVLHLLHARLEDLGALVTARGKLLVVALAAVQELVLRAEGLVYER